MYSISPNCRPLSSSHCCLSRARRTAELCRFLTIRDEMPGGGSRPIAGRVWAVPRPPARTIPPACLGNTTVEQGLIGGPNVEFPRKILWCSSSQQPDLRATRGGKAEGAGKNETSRRARAWRSTRQQEHLISGALGSSSLSALGSLSLARGNGQAKDWQTDEMHFTYPYCYYTLSLLYSLLSAS